MASKNKIAIIGFGAEGAVLFDYFSKKDVEIHIFDEEKVDVPAGAVFHQGLDIPAEFSVVYKSPGVPTHKLKLGSAKTKISSLTNLFLENIKGQVIGVTGTKGKGTICSLIYYILEQAGYDVALLGNIGRVSLSFLADNKAERIYVYELSSFQCEHLSKSPHVAVLTNLFTAHLDHHQEFDEYVKAKLKITAGQTEQDYFINTSGRDVETKAKKISVDFETGEISTQVESLDDLPLVTDKKIFATKLVGWHNQINSLVAYLVCRIIGVADDRIRQSIKTFQPLKYRIEKVAEKNGVIFYDDSLATVPEATLASIKALENVSTLILGGYDKGEDFSVFAAQLAKTNIQNFIVFPDTGPRMVTQVAGRNIFPAASMEEAIRLAYEHTKGICLLSNASPSFNMFKNYKDKSAQYREWIEKLG